MSLGMNLKPDHARRYRAIKRMKDAHHGGLFTPVFRRGEVRAARRQHTTVLIKLTTEIDGDE